MVAVAVAVDGTDMAEGVVAAPNPVAEGAVVAPNSFAEFPSVLMQMN